MRILFLGDVMGRAGRAAIANDLPRLRAQLPVTNEGAGLRLGQLIKHQICCDIKVGNNAVINVLMNGDHTVRQCFGRIVRRIGLTVEHHRAGINCVNTAYSFDQS